ncbi:hypothetical protein [Saccharopolyspora pogona]|uniref:hypothetical protein n=1 Tax=Saccharopolyspora pogona TaxID=333966 RepID=UPI001689657C|nr:hypothetical protein [Saccharopolyspora pogona]
MTDASDLPIQNVAVTVFVSVPAVDQLDGAFIAEIAVRQALRSTCTDTKTRRHTVQLRDGEQRDLTVAAVREIGMAVRNGDLWISPTHQPFRLYEQEQEATQ